MIDVAPASYHLDLYRYWRGQRGDRLMPTRRDIDPADIPRLLPHIGLIENENGNYRWRLMGSRLVNDFGCDLTGQPFGSHVVPEWFIGAMAATFDQVLGDGEPVFEESVYKTALRATQAVSRLLLPLGPEADRPAMILFTRIARRMPLTREVNALHGASGRLCGSFQIASVEELQRRVAAWDLAAAPAPVAQISSQPVLRVANLWGRGFPRVLRCGGSGKAVLLAPLPRP